MNNINILDCTLRDGGYCNNWNFGFDNIKKIINNLQESKIDIIECGFLTDSFKNQPPYSFSKFNNLEQIKNILPQNKKNCKFVAMINYGDFNISNLPQYDNNSSFDGIRVAFHKKDLDAALEVCKKIKEKGYLVFVQPMLSSCYSDSEFLSLIEKVNQFTPYAFYIVDSFGTISVKNLVRLFYIVENNLNRNIWIGFHSHNNMQLAFSNAQSLLDIQVNRNLIIDSSIFGMGRGAGNLNTELFINCLNENFGKDYKLSPILNVIDEILNNFYQKNPWGYSLQTYLSAKHNIHPNYASFLTDKNTLTIEDINKIFSLMEESKKYTFDKKYIEQLYLSYMSKFPILSTSTSLSENLKTKTILLIAPGKSSDIEKDKIIAFANLENVVTISINFNYSHYTPKYIFVSNLRRFKQLPHKYHNKLITTSNIPCDNAYYKAKYSDLLLSEEGLEDNAGLMAIKLLISLGVKRIRLAGFDGYSVHEEENFINNLTLAIKKSIAENMNIGMSKTLKAFSKTIDLEFLTTPKKLTID